LLDPNFGQQKQAVACDTACLNSCHLKDRLLSGISIKQIR